MTHRFKSLFLPLLGLAFFLLSCNTPLEAQDGEPVFTTMEPGPTYNHLFTTTKSALEPLGYPVGRAGRSAYVIDQYVTLYEGANAVNDAAADSLLMANTYGNAFQQIKTCGCQGNFQIRLWQVDGIGGEERGKKGKEEVADQIGREEGVAPNYYLFPARPTTPMAPQQFDQLPANYSPAGNPSPQEPILIAVIDSGVDPTLEINSVPGQADLYLWQNPNEPIVNGAGDPNDPFCFTDDVIGWDFVNNDNNPSDDNSHGTHVTGIIAKRLATNAPNLAYEFMPLKVLDHNGVGNTFDAMCAVMYATMHKADIINASWGYYGDSDPLLEKAFRYAQRAGIVTSTSAGNDRVDLSDIAHYPGQFGLQIPGTMRGVMVTSGLANNPIRLWGGTNYRSEGPNVDGTIAGPATNITSLIPTYLVTAGLSPVKTGTSMSAPFLTALAARYRLFRPQDRPHVVRHNLIYMIQAEAPSRFFTSDGVQYPYYLFNWLDIPALYAQYNANMITN